jgi:hypothetical protein
MKLTRGTLLSDVDDRAFNAPVIVFLLYAVGGDEELFARRSGAQGQRSGAVESTFHSP